jgi:type II secretory pathway component PulC
MLASGALIEEIHRDHVVLKSDGSHLKLYLAGMAQPDDKELNRATIVGGPGVADRPVETRADSREDFSAFLTPTLIFDGEKVTGFRITPGKSVSHLQRLGLASGDVIRAIDGRPVERDADWQKVAGALAGGTSVVLSVERSDSLVSVLMDGARLKASTDAATAAVPVTGPST